MMEEKDVEGKEEEQKSVPPDADAGEDKDDSEDAPKYRDLYQKALIKNMQIVMNDRKGKYENRCSTFFMSAHVGMHTILVLD